MNSTNQESEKKVNELVGTVMLSGRDKTAKILIEKHVKHGKYGKYIRRSTVIHAHDEGNICQEGNLVRISPCRRYSKTKSWIVTGILK
jgi:small subunit ribosomal protein S17